MPGSKHSLVGVPLIDVTGTDQTIVTAPANRKVIYVVAYTIVASAATAIPSFKSGSTAITGGMIFAANGGASPSAPGDDSWLFRTNPGDALILNLAGAGTVSGHLTYYLG